MCVRLRCLFEKGVGKPGKDIAWELKPTWVSASNMWGGAVGGWSRHRKYMSLALGPSVQRTSGARVPRRGGRVGDEAVMVPWGLTGMLYIISEGWWGTARGSQRWLNTTECVWRAGCRELESGLGVLLDCYLCPCKIWPWPGPRRRGRGENSAWRRGQKWCSILQTEQPGEILRK